MFTIAVFFYLIISSGYSFNDNPWEKWDAETIARANTAANIEYLSVEEKQVILFTNLARLNGPLFLSTFLSSYMENIKPSKYSRSLTRELKKIRNLQPLYPESDLYEAALSHAMESGKSGHAGHRNFDRRFKPLMGKYNLVAENCAYGFDKAIDIVIQLLIDEDVPNLGHRKNMLNPGFNSTGVSIQPHKKYNYNCVISYGKK